MSRVNRWIVVTLAAVWFVALAPSAAVAQSVIRGPYLQMGTPTSVVVRWRTDVATKSRVLYGLDPGGLASSTVAPASTTEHVVTLAGLSPATRYYYAVGGPTNVQAGGDASYSFLTSPPAGTAVPTRIWVIGDSGTANSSARAVRDAYAGLAAPGSTNLW